MNRELMENIVRHIFSNFAIIPSTFINLKKSKSLMDKEFLLPEHIPFEIENSNSKWNRVWGCQIATDQQEIKILLGDCSEEKHIPEYALLVQLKDTPIYSMYLVNSNFPDVSSDAMLAVTMNGKEWMECNTFLQATFLAGMEQIKDYGLAWVKCTNYKTQFDALLSFINYHHGIYGGDHEGA